MSSEPLSATPAWRVAVQAADGTCRCRGACGRKHTAGRGACTARHGVNGARLHLTTDQRVYCTGCFSNIDKAATALAAAEHAEANAERYAQDTLFGS